ncbi:MAG TPA: ABC transporter permease [Bacillota bacterium]|nr:ABC transporter permease [Bacillota bacterium]
MTTYLIKRLVQSLATILGIVTLVFFLLRAAPGDPIALLIPPDLPPGRHLEVVAEIRARYGFDRPVVEQYFTYVWRMLRGDFGRSIRTGAPILDELVVRIPNTLQLGIMAMLATTLLGVIAGVIAAVNRGRHPDTAVMFLSIAGISIPDFWFGLMLMVLLGLYWGILPPSGFGGPVYTLEGLRYLVLPLLTLSRGAAGLARFTRSSMLDVISQDYIRTARSKGLAERVVVYRHALKNAMIPVVTILGQSFGFLVGGVVIVETVFAWPGVGRYLVSGITGRDYPVVQAGVLMIATSVVFANLITDMFYGFLDPRIRYE